MAVAPVQVDKEDVVQVQLQAGPAGTRGSRTCQVCRSQVKVSSAHPLTSRPTVPSVLGLTPSPWPKPCAPHSGCPTPGHKGADWASPTSQPALRLSLPDSLSHSRPISVSPFLDVPSQIKGN